MTAHPDDAAWERLACGESTAVEREATMDHVSACGSCAALYRSVVRLHAEARRFDADVPDLVPPPAVASGWLGWWGLVPVVLIAALVVIAIAVPLLVRGCATRF